MQYLPCLNSVETEITIEKLDKVAQTFSEKVKSFAKLFGILISWCIFNLIVSLFFNRTRSLSLDTYRMITEGLRNVATQDVFFVLSLIFDNKFCYIISVAILLWGGVAFFIRFLDLVCESVAETNVNKHSKSVQSKLQSEIYVVSYKQQVAFLA